MSVTNGETSARPTILDALPYYDNDLDLHPALRQKVEKELARENKPHQTLHPLVPPEIALFAKNPVLQAELERVEKHEPLPTLDTVRYQLPAPTSVPGSEGEWKAALDNAKAQLEHLRIRQDNLALLQNYGANAWKVNNYILENNVKAVEKALEELKERTTEVNRERKQFQTRLGGELTSLETRWTELISNVLQIELANIALEGEIEALSRKEVELSGI